MSWQEAHRRSASLARAAHGARRAGDEPLARRLFVEAARSQASALYAPEPARQRTLDLMAVNASWLFRTAGEDEMADDFIDGALRAGVLSIVGRTQLEEIADLCRRPPPPNLAPTI